MEGGDEGGGWGKEVGVGERSWSFAAKRSRSVDGKRTTIWSPRSTSPLPFLNTPSLRALSRRHTVDACPCPWHVCVTDIVCVFVCLSPHNVNMALCHMLLQREERAEEREQKVCVWEYHPQLALKTGLLRVLEIVEKTWILMSCFQGLKCALILNKAHEIVIALLS